MAIYALQDIEVTDDGDIVIDEFGEIKIASPLRTVAQAIDWVLLTNKGELVAEPSFGANIQSFYGDSNIGTTHQFMEASIIQELGMQGLVEIESTDIDVVPIETDEATILIHTKGNFLDTESETGAFTRFIDQFDGVVRAYIYPFTSGTIKPITT